ncbi:MAG: diaminopropionate ammonia-lyase [Anaerolineaceae bacterium]|nr:diaminopropionate ammonia-lyase [Anaerolineaceae bacterium]
MTIPEPITWISNPRAATITHSPAVEKYFPPGIAENVRDFHSEISAYRVTPLKSLERLADQIGLDKIWVKDEANRLSLGSFKVLGGSYAIHQTILKRLGNPPGFTFSDLRKPEVRAKVGDLIFAAATDGNHGRGVAWAATKLGFKSIIYVHKHTSEARIQAIARNGAIVKVVEGTYDDAVRQVNEDAQRNGWQVVSDTSWEGYEEIPIWVMRGYTTLFSEVQQQLVAMGKFFPTHIFMQAGVGTLAASAFGYYASLFAQARPKMVVVEPDKAACLFHSMEVGDGKPHSISGELDTIMAGLACGDPNPIAWEVLYDCADGFIKCPDYVAAKGMRVGGVPLHGDPSIIAGESGAVTLGALMFIMELDRYKFLREELGLDENSQVLLVNSEQNTDPDDYRRVVWDGGDQIPRMYRVSRNPFAEG